LPNQVEHNTRTASSVESKGSESDVKEDKRERLGTLLLRKRAFRTRLWVLLRVVQALVPLSPRLEAPAAVAGAQMLGIPQARALAAQ